MIKLNNNELWQSRKKKKTSNLTWIIIGIITLAGIGTITYFTWSKKETKPETKTTTEEKVQKIQIQLNSLKSKLNNLADTSEKRQLENKVNEVENKVKNLSSQDESTIQQLEQEIKDIKQELEGDEPDNSGPLPENPDNNPPAPDNSDPNQNKPIEYVATKINDNTFKYHFAATGDRNRKKLDWGIVVSLLGLKTKTFFQVFQGALKDANSKFSAYFWKCPPVSKKTLNKPFEFVVIKSEDLNNTTQNKKPFNQYLAETSLFGKSAIAFPNNQSPSDAILVIPAVKPASGEKYDYKNISQFTKNAPEEQQQSFWQEVADNLMKELEKSDAPRWLNTHGLGVRYLHVRIDEGPKYYEDYIEYKYL